VRGRAALGALALLAAATLAANWLAFASPAGKAPLAPVTRGSYLIGRGTMLQPQLLDLSDGQWIGAWLSGSATRRTLTVALLDSRRGLVRERVVPAAALTDGGSLLDTPLLASGPDGQVVMLGRAIHANTHTAQLMLTSWNATLRGQPQTRPLGSVALVTTPQAIDDGPQGQYLSYQSTRHAYLLVEVNEQPWIAPSSWYKNRPQLLLSLINLDGSLQAQRAIAMPPAQSFIVPTVRVDPAGNGWNLFVIHPGDALRDGSIGYDALWLYRLNPNLATPAAPTVIEKSAQADGQILDAAVCTDAPGNEFVIWEDAGPSAAGGGQAKWVVGQHLSAGKPVGSTSTLTQAISPNTTSPAQLMLVCQRGGALIAMNTGTQEVFAASAGDGAAHSGAIFSVAKSVGIQPPDGVAYDPANRALAAVWQDPVTATAPDSVSSNAPLYLSLAGT
jgi:hypothetical protein